MMRLLEEVRKLKELSVEAVMSGKVELMLEAKRATAQWFSENSFIILDILDDALTAQEKEVCVDDNN